MARGAMARDAIGASTRQSSTRARAMPTEDGRESGRTSSTTTFADDWRAFADAASASARVASDRARALARATSERARATTTALQALTPERVAWFLALSATSALMYALAFAVGAPTLAIAPAKFGLCLSGASASGVCATGALRGARAQVTHMLSEERAVVSVVMVASMVMTVRAAVVRHAYAQTVFWSACQTCAVGYYQVSYFPYGAQGFRAVCATAWQIAQPVLGGCARAIGLAASSRGGTGGLPV